MNNIFYKLVMAVGGLSNATRTPQGDSYCILKKQIYIIWLLAYIIESNLFYKLIENDMQRKRMAKTKVYIIASGCSFQPFHDDSN